PVPDLVDDLGLGGADLFLELPEQGGLRILARIDPALGHLPGFDIGVYAASHEDLAAAIEQGDTDAGTIRQIRHLAPNFRKRRSGAQRTGWRLATALTGTRSMPRAESPRAQSATTLMVTG